MMEKESRPQGQSAPLLGDKDWIPILRISESTLSHRPTPPPGEYCGPAVDWDPGSGALGDPAEGSLPETVWDDVALLASTETLGPSVLWRHPITLSFPSLKHTLTHLRAKAHIWMSTLPPSPGMRLSLTTVILNPLGFSFITSFPPQGCA